jgi:hypothetical protein
MLMCGDEQAETLTRNRLHGGVIARPSMCRPSLPQLWVSLAAVFLKRGGGVGGGSVRAWRRGERQR